MNADPRCAVWTLDPVLAGDTVALGDLQLCRVLLSKDANYPWLLLVPRLAGASEIADLPNAEQMQLMTEIAQASHTLKALTRCDKINVAALGNVVAQLHVHVIARFRTDQPGPSRCGTRRRPAPTIPTRWAN
jgi:diadenosine tetraphosphate (Ap4A) HIT family hydrolase